MKSQYGFFCVFLFLFFSFHQAKSQQISPLHSPFLSAKDCLTPESLINSSFVKKNSSLYQSLLDMGLAYSITNKIIEEARQKINLQFIKPGTPLTVFKKWNGSFHRILIPLDSLNFLEITKNKDDQWDNNLREVETQKEVFHSMGLVEDNFWNSATEQKNPPPGHYSVCRDFWLAGRFFQRGSKGGFLEFFN